MFKNRVRGVVVTLGILGIWIGAAWIENETAFLLSRAVAMAVAMMGVCELVGCISKAWPQMSDDKKGLIIVGLMLLAIGLACVQIELQKNLVWCVLVVGIPAVNDSAAMIAGKTLGKKMFPRKINPKISPNKTWVGMGGGILSCLIIFGLLNNWLWQWRGLEFSMIVCTLALWANMGDFGLSQVKRLLDVKDFSDLLGKGGHGGFLDRFGNYYPVALVAFALRDYRGGYGGGLIDLTWMMSLLCAVCYYLIVSDDGEQESKK